MARITKYRVDCPDCKSADRVTRKGRYLTAGDGHYRMICRACKITFTRLIPELIGTTPAVAPRDRKLPNQGESHPQAKLTERDVKDILSLSASGSYPIELAERYGVAKATIAAILNGKSWSSFTGISSHNSSARPKYKYRGK